jgi:dienelactone hydrolase
MRHDASVSTRSRSVRVATALLTALTLAAGGGTAVASPSHQAKQPTAAQLMALGVVPNDCYQPAGSPDPSTDAAAWRARDIQNEICSTQRLQDELANPAFLRLSAMEFAGSNPNQIFGELNDPRPRSWGSLFVAGGDPFRVPTRWEAMGRGQWQVFNFISVTGAKLQAELYSPNPRPGRRYPVVTFTPGLQESKEQAWWYGQALAEAGYVVLAIDPQGQGDSEVTSHSKAKCNPLCDFPTDDKPETQAAINFALSTPSHPYQPDLTANGKHTLPYNPLWREVKRDALGIAGHSLGATAVTQIGQGDRRVKAVISYDNLDQTVQPNLVKRIHAPTLWYGTDYQFPTFATPKLAGDKINPRQHMPAYDQLVRAGVDTMEITPRASTHYEWDQQSALGSLPASRYGQVTSIYYTVAWFDYYLKHSRTALRRLTATHYDGSADKHSIGGGTYDWFKALMHPTDPAAGNVPYKIKGVCVADTLSFYYASAYWLDDGERQSANMRNRGCS